MSSILCKSDKLYAQLMRHLPCIRRSPEPELVDNVEPEPLTEAGYVNAELQPVGGFQERCIDDAVAKAERSASGSEVTEKVTLQDLTVQCMVKKKLCDYFIDTITTSPLGAGGSVTAGVDGPEGQLEGHGVNDAHPGDDGSDNLGGFDDDHELLIPVCSDIGEENPASALESSHTFTSLPTGHSHHGDNPAASHSDSPATKDVEEDILTPNSPAPRGIGSSHAPEPSVLSEVPSEPGTGAVCFACGFTGRVSAHVGSDEISHVCVAAIRGKFEEITLGQNSRKQRTSECKQVDPRP